MKKMLVVYYSYSHGNTKRIAEALAKNTKATLACIETREAYQGSYDEVVEQGQKEVNEGYLPPIQNIQGVEDYDIIAIGTPTWWYTMAPAVATFLHAHDWKGKTVIPFMTNAGWPGTVIQDMSKAVNGAVVKEALEVKFDQNGGDHLETSQKTVDEWIHRVEELLK